MSGPAGRCEAQTERPFKRAGFSLIETSLALGILALLIMGLMAGAVAARRSAEATVHAALADAVSTGFLEQLRSIQFSTLLEKAESNGTVTFTIEDGTPIEVALNGESFVAIEVPLDAQPVGSGERYLDYAFRPSVTVGFEQRILTMAIDYRWRPPTDTGARFHRLTLSRSAVPQL